MNLRLPQASAHAPQTDALILSLLVISLAVLALVFGLMLTYVVRYRSGNPLDRGKLDDKTWRIEIAWTAATLAVFFGLFLWGAGLYVNLFQAPPDALKISVIGKQWMWKVEYPGGQREINQLHVPVNRPVQLVMASEDVIHDFAVPAFRIKHDVLPGRYQTEWFTATEPGVYSLFCTQYCGTDHSSMIGRVTVMSGPDYAAWLARNPAADDLVAAGRELFTRYGCSGCHAIGPGTAAGSTVRAPSLVGVYGGPVPLSDGSVVTADEMYIRDSILEPNKQIVASYEPLMPSFAGVVSEEDLVRIIAFVKSLSVAGAQG
ncbi:MAG: cytochrome c oxidase subunit II [Acetobacteraceae bacterium]|nr:cytochrome c oxidase subunit II [Acetobacteraceae bacterium]